MPTSIIPIERIAERILVLRGHRVMLDADLAKLYGVPTKVLNQAVKRNVKRFPPDFMFRLTAEEKAEVVTVCDHLPGLRYSPVMPHAFTDHGAVMLAGVLNSQKAVEVSILIVRAFNRLRQILASHAELARKLDALETRYDAQFRIVFDAIRELMEPPPDPPKPPIGFATESEGGLNDKRITRKTKLRSK